MVDDQSWIYKCYIWSWNSEQRKTLCFQSLQSHIGSLALCIDTIKEILAVRLYSIFHVNRRMYEGRVYFKIGSKP